MLRSDPADALWEHSAGIWLLDLTIGVLLAAAALAATSSTLRRIDPKVTRPTAQAPAAARGRAPHAPAGPPAMPRRATGQPRRGRRWGRGAAGERPDPTGTDAAATGRPWLRPPVAEAISATGSPVRGRRRLPAAIVSAAGSLGDRRCRGRLAGRHREFAQHPE
ncbi:hypothetical protein [Parafrankia sp. CH37]|uniref:hypothetical protein n=1 Tax=Parafrankia sp. CH37 TaxID=683308 RepID=UPI0037C6AD12